MISTATRTPELHIGELAWTISPQEEGIWKKDIDPKKLLRRRRPTEIVFAQFSRALRQRIELHTALIDTTHKIEKPTTPLTVVIYLEGRKAPPLQQIEASAFWILVCGFSCRTNLSWLVRHVASGVHGHKERHVHAGECNSWWMLIYEQEGGWI